MRLYLSFAAVICLICMACQKPKTNHNKFDDPNMVKLYQWSDERNAEAVSQYFKSETEQIRAEAALCFASIQDTAYIPQLISLLNDKSNLVEVAAAYSLGQFGNEKAFKEMVLLLGTQNISEPRYAMMEACAKLMGKIDQTKCKNEVDLYNKFLFDLVIKDDAGLHAYGKSMEWLHINGVFSQRLMARFPYLIQTSEAQSRETCAIAMSRYSGDWFKENEDYLTKWVVQERNPNVKRHILTMLAKTKNPAHLPLIKSMAETVTMTTPMRVSAIRAMAIVPNLSTKELLVLIGDTDEYIAKEALRVAESCTDVKQHISAILEITAKQPLPIAAHGLRIGIKNGESSLNEKAWMYYGAATSPYDQAALILALAADKSNAKRINQTLLASSSIPVKYACAEALVEIGTDGWASSQEWFSSVVQPSFDQGDIGVVSVLATGIREMKSLNQLSAPLSELMKTGMSKLKLPAEIETYNELVRTYNALTKEEMPEQKAESKHPIDWNLVKSIPIDQHVRIVTSKGEFILTLNVNDCPGSVANFVELVKQGFFNNKNFHRVIPNFVAQGGCPRGDGMGSTDYTIRSEFALHNYSEGAVGLASSGRDTESCQWFVTHVPTPHLEGRYTIIGYVTSGLENVQHLQIGDLIEKVELIEK